MSERPDWFVAIKVPAGKLEEYMLFAYQHGGELREFAPEVAEHIKELTKALPNGKAAPQIADQSKPAKQLRGNEGDGLKGTCKGFILKHLRRRPRHPRELRDLAREKGVTWDLNGISPRLNELKDKKLVQITPHGWELTELGHELSKQALVGSNDWRAKKVGRPPKPDLGERTQVDIAEDILKAAHPKFVLLGQVRDAFVAHGKRRDSASTALHWMKVNGRCVAGAEPATYQWIPPDQRAPEHQQETK